MLDSGQLDPYSLRWGRLKISCVFSLLRYRRSTIETLADSVMAALRLGLAR
jgi:hypothetical protein